MKLTFCGGAQVVTGANYLLETSQAKVLVDCGMEQGDRHAEETNYQPFSYNPAEIDFVFITHAHVDHVGLLPKLLKHGFKGKIFMTPPTRDLAYLNLVDSESIIHHEAEEHHLEPLYEKQDVEAVFDRVETTGYQQLHDLGKGVTFRLRNAGHILGSSIVELWLEDGAEKKKFVFSGDLGNPPVLFLDPTEFIDEADYVFVESAYGNRIHEGRAERKNKLEDVLESSIGSGGVLVIPAFALERTQEILFEMEDLINNHRVPDCPIFIDSPLAIAMTEVYEKYPDFLNERARAEFAQKKKFLESPRLHFTKTVEESKAINHVSPPKIIMAGSGMSTAGRIIFHERLYLPDPKNTILIIGYQTQHSLGRKLVDHVSPVRIMGEEVPVRAHVKAIGGYSAHADQTMLLNWVNHFQTPPRKVFVVQGEPESSQALSQLIRDHLGFDASVPTASEEMEV